MHILTSAELFNFFGYRIFPLFWAATFLSIPVFTSVPPNLWIVDGNTAYGAVIAYGLVLAALGIAPHRYPRLHPIGAALAVLVLLGRAGGFVEVAIERGEWSLTSAVLERLAFAAALLFWHQASSTVHSPNTVAVV